MVPPPSCCTKHTLISSTSSRIFLPRKRPQRRSVFPGIPSLSCLLIFLASTGNLKPQKLSRVDKYNSKVRIPTFSSHISLIISLAHNFFDEQPVKNADIYFMRVVLHDWPDHKVKIIMNKIHAAAGPSSKFIVLDSLAAYTCEDPTRPALGPKAPAPLLANYGASGAGYATMGDIHVSRCPFIQRKGH